MCILCNSRLSPPIRSLLDRLKATHTSRKIIGFAKENGGLVRKDPIDSVHPVVRIHPVTGERAIFLNSEFVVDMPGLKTKESELLLDFLINHIETGHDFQCRVQWERYSVVMFDGRNTLRKFFPCGEDPDSFEARRLLNLYRYCDSGL